MVILCAGITNMGSKPAVVCYGKIPNSGGPSGNGYSVVSSGSTVKTDWTMGQTLEAALAVHVRNNYEKKTTWRIYNADWKVHVYAAEADDGAEEETPLDRFELVESIDVVIGEDSFSLYVGDYHSIAIVNDTQALQWLGEPRVGNSFSRRRK